MADIQNFGNHIGGSRADQWKAGKLLAEEISGMTEEEITTYVTRDSLWPREKAEYAVNELDKLPELAYFQNLMRTSLPPKPLRAGREEAERYAETVTKIRDAVMASNRAGYAVVPEAERTGPEDSGLRTMKDFVLSSFTTKKSLYYVDVNPENASAINNKFIQAAQTSPEKLKRDADKKNYGLTKEQAAQKAAMNNYSVYQYRGMLSADEIENAMRSGEPGAYFCKDELFDDLGNRKTEFTNDGERPTKARLEVPVGFGRSFYYIRGNNLPMQPENWKEGSYFVVTNGNREIVKINMDKAEAEKTAEVCAEIEKAIRMKDMEEKSISKKKSGKQKFTPETLQNIERTGGEDFTKGMDITGDDMIRAFGFHGGEFGNWTSQEERQGNLNMCYNALCDLAGVLGMDTTDISLGGDLSIAFGARGRGNGALAHYEPTYKVINLTKETSTRKTGGAGALSHEWGHALDAKLGAMAGLTCTLLSDRYDADRFRTKRLEGIPGTMLEILDAMRYKTATEKLDYTEKIRNQERKLFKQLDIYKPNTLTEAQEKEWDEAARGLVANAKTVYLDDADRPELLTLSRIRKETTGHVLTADARVSLETCYCYMLAHTRLMAENQEKDGVERKVDTDFYKGSLGFDKLFHKESKGYWASSCEMFARAFDCYVSDKLKEAGIRDDYLTAYANSYKATVDDKKISAVPEGEEREKLNLLFDKLIGELHEIGLFHEPMSVEQENVIEEENLFSISDSAEFNKVVIPKEMEAILPELKERLATTGNYIETKVGDNTVFAIDSAGRAAKVKTVADMIAEEHNLEPAAKRTTKDREDAAFDIAEAVMPDTDVLWAVSTALKEHGISRIGQEPTYGQEQAKIYVNAADMDRAEGILQETLDKLSGMARLEIPSHGFYSGYDIAVKALDNSKADYIGGYSAVFCDPEKAERYADYIDGAIKANHKSWREWSYTKPKITYPEGWTPSGPDVYSADFAASVDPGSFVQMDLFSMLTDNRDR